jgi:hypothetical protein
MAALAHPTLLAAAVLATGVALVYVHVGRVLLRRPASGQARQALQMFALWWIATALNILLGSLANAAAAFGWTDLSLQVTYILLQRLLLAVALVGLLHYLLVLVRGRSPLRLLVGLYALYFVYLAGSVFYNGPTGVFVGHWRTDLEYARASQGPGLPDLLSFLALVVPTVGLSVAAVVVARRLPEPQRPQRNRMTLVGLALIVWWVVAVLAGQRQALEQDWYQVFNRVLDLGMALLILWGYEPPDWLRRHVDLPRDLPDEAPGAVASPRP